MFKETNEFRGERVVIRQTYREKQTNREREKRKSDVDEDLLVIQEKTRRSLW